jgi:hypothetical protein
LITQLHTPTHTHPPTPPPPPPPPVISSLHNAATSTFHVFLVTVTLSESVTEFYTHQHIQIENIHTIERSNEKRRSTEQMY